MCHIAHVNIFLFDECGGAKQNEGTTKDNLGEIRCVAMIIIMIIPTTDATKSTSIKQMYTFNTLAIQFCMPRHSI